ncbi:hypothetical protein BH23VER1_BH23VER1_01820 [soil metagenome]
MAKLNEPPKGSRTRDRIRWLAIAHAGLLLAPAGAQTFSGSLQPGETPIVFASFGDCGDRHTTLNPAKVASMVKGWDIDFIVAAGDLNYGNTSVGHPDWEARIGTRYGDWIVGRTDHKYPLQTGTVPRYYPVVGNHDTDTGAGFGGLGGGKVSGYVDYFVRNAPGEPDRIPTGSGVHNDDVTYYDFYHGNVHIIAADSDRGRVDTVFAVAQNAWIANALESSEGRWKFVVMHHPAWSSGAVHGNQAWMQGDHLAMADAVIAAHAHLYERIETDGTVFVNCGLGGRPFYPFRADPHPDSKFRFNSAHGALRISCTSTGALLEFVSTDDGAEGANGGTVLDSVTLGDYTPTRNVGVHALELVAGQEVTVETALPQPAGGDGNQLDPKVEIVAPDGSVAAAEAAGAGDGINVRLDFVVGGSGRHEVRVLPEDESGGDYQLSVTPSPPLPERPIDVWRAQHFGFDADSSVAGDLADPDGDGIPNLTEYAMGTPPTVADAPVAGGEATPQFFNDTAFFVLRLAEGLRDDLGYAIQGSASLDAGGWVTVATRAVGGGPWTGTAPVVVSPGQGRAIDLRVAEVTNPLVVPRRFYRLQVSRPE